MNRELHFSTGNDVWETPQDLYEKLNCEFSFTVDAAALPENAKCERFFTPEQNGLLQDWSNETVWLNPPYSRELQRAFIRKAYMESQKGATVVMLLPARTDTSLFHEIILPYGEIRFLRGRLKFSGAKFNAPFPSMVVVFRGPSNRKQTVNIQQTLF